MNLTLHQFKTDFHHFRWRLAVLWCSFAAEAALADLNLFSGNAIGVSNFLIEIWLMFYTLALVVSIIQADPLVGTSAAWLTRPVRRQHIFWAKSAFIVLCLFIPRLVIQVLGWELRGYSPYLMWIAIEQSLLLGVTFVAVVAVLAALTRDLARFSLAAGITIAFIFVTVLLVDWLVHAGFLHEVHLEWSHEFHRSTCADTVAFLVLAAATLLAWLLQARAALWRIATICLAAGFLAMPFISTLWSWNFLTLHLTPSVPLTLSLLEADHPPVTNPQSQVIAPEFAVDGVPENDVALIRNLSAKMLFPGDRTTTDLRNDDDFFGNFRDRPEVTQSGGNYLGIIRGYFPTNTIWFNEDFFGGIGDPLLNPTISKRFLHGPPSGDLNGQATVDLYNVKQVAAVPLQPASFEALPGLRVTIQEVTLVGDAISVAIDECNVSLMFDRDVDTARTENMGAVDPTCTYVLYHPGTGEAYVVSQRNSRSTFPPMLSSESHVDLDLNFSYPALRERFAGVSAADWLREARLCVFVPVYAGTSFLPFQRQNYRWPWGSSGNLRQQKEKFEDAQAIAQASLPANPTAAQLDAYLDEILLNAPQSWDEALGKTIERKLAAVDVNGVPALLRHLPLDNILEYNFVFPAIEKFVTRDQLPDLRNALQRDNEVVNIFLGKHWEADARDILVAKLPDHREPLPADALRIAAQAKNPATYSDLLWHFTHLKSGQASVVAVLKQCPGFDVNNAIQQAWQNARLGIIGPGELAAIAAEQGLPDALNQAVIHIESFQDAWTRNRELAHLAVLTSYSGPTNETFAWLASNLGHFQFDPAQHRYFVATEH